MKGGNYSESQKMAERRAGPSPRPRRGIMMDGKGKRPETVPDVGTAAPPFQFTSDGHGDPAISDGQLSSSTWRFLSHFFLLGWESLLFSWGQWGQGEKNVFCLQRGRIPLKVTLKNQTSLPTHRNNCKHNTLVTCVHFICWLALFWSIAPIWRLVKFLCLGQKGRTPLSTLECDSVHISWLMEGARCRKTCSTLHDEWRAGGGGSTSYSAIVFIIYSCWFIIRNIYVAFVPISDIELLKSLKFPE